MRKRDVAVVLTVCIAMYFIGVVVGCDMANAQTPPVSTVGTMPDTVTSFEVVVPFTVASDIPWAVGGGVGLYYRIPGVTGWLYVGWAYISPITFLASVDNEVYQFATHVTDNEGNHEIYPGDRDEPQEEAEVYVCTACIGPPDCPPPSIAVAVVTLAQNGITSWGQANEPKYRWHWTHSDCVNCSDPVRYLVEWKVDEVVSVIDSVAAGDTTFAFIDLPVTPGQTQTVRVCAFDADNHVSIFSMWGVPIDDRLPGQPPQPQHTLIMTGPDSTTTRRN